MEINLPVPAIFPKAMLKPLLYVALSLIIAVISSGSFSRLEPLKFAPQPPESLDHLPFTFVANEGQAEPQVKFIVQSLGGTLLFTPAGLTLALPSPDLTSASGQPMLVQVQFENANPQVQISGAKKLPGRVNYFIGNDPDRWQTNLSTWAGLTYQELYAGINLDYTGQSGHLKSTYTVAPGVDPGQIRWRYEGHPSAEVGAMAIDTAGYIYVTGNTNSTDFPIKNGYQSSNSGGNDAFIAKLDPAQNGNASLIYSTYLGGTNDDFGYDIAVDDGGNSYITGSTLSTNFPVQDAYQEACGGDDNCLYGDAFIAKLNGAGNSLLYGSYLGGANEEVGYGITLDYLDNIYITGRTASDDFPTKNAYQDDYANAIDGFVTKLQNETEEVLPKLYLPVILAH